MSPSYHYRIRVATGYAQAVRGLIEVFDSVATQNDGSIALDGNDLTLLGVVADGFDSLPGLKLWADAHPQEELDLVTAVGTTLAVRETDAASLRSAVQTHPELEAATPAPVGPEAAGRFEWRYAPPRPRRANA
jgi:hypothetical protein